MYKGGMKGDEEESHTNSSFVLSHMLLLCNEQCHYCIAVSFFEIYTLHMHAYIRGEFYYDLYI